MDERIKLENQRDLKIYRAIIAIVFIISIIIAMIVGIVTTNSYVAEAKLTNGIIDILMPKTITGAEGEQYVDGMTFYREKNKSYNPIKDEPVKAFNYYWIDNNGKKIYLDDGNYYPAEYYNKDNKDIQPVAVFAGFYFQVLANWNMAKRIIKTVMSFIILAVLGVAIYLWYLNWSKREDEKKRYRQSLESK